MLLFEIYQSALNDRLDNCTQILSKRVRRLEDDGVVERQLGLAEDDLTSLQTIYKASLPPSEQRSHPELTGFMEDAQSRITRLKQTFAQSTVGTNRLTRERPPPPPPMMSASVLKSMQISAEDATQLNNLESLLRAGHRSEAAGAESLQVLAHQRSQMSGTQASMKRVDGNVKESQAVLNRVSNWLNQFK